MSTSLLETGALHQWHSHTPSNDAAAIGCIRNNNIARGIEFYEFQLLLLLEAVLGENAMKTWSGTQAAIYPPKHGVFPRWKKANKRLKFLLFFCSRVESNIILLLLFISILIPFTRDTI